MDVCEVVRDKLLELIPEDILKESGAVLYSSYYTVKPGKFMIFGLNPGGDPETVKMTVREDIDYKYKKCQENPKWNEYFDEEWIPSEPGCDRLQVNIRYFIRLLLGDREVLRDICATNLIFVRTKGEEFIRHMDSLVEKCWKVHKWLLEQVEPELIIIYSSKAYNCIHRRLLSGEVKKETREVEFSNRIKVKITKISRPENSNQFLLCVPHLSRYTFLGKEHVVDEIKRELMNLGCLSVG